MTIDLEVLTPQAAKATNKALNSKEYTELIDIFNQRVESWDGQSSIDIKTSGNTLVNNMFTAKLAKSGWHVKYGTRKQSDMKGETWDENIFQISERVDYSYGNK